MFIICQLADLATWAVMDKSRELNPLVVTLGPALAVVGKVSLVGLVAALAYRFRTVAYEAVLIFGAVIGSIGAFSNL